MKKILMLLLALVAVVAVGVTPVFAEDEDTSGEDTSGGDTSICDNPDIKSVPNYDTLCGGGTEKEAEGNLQAEVNSILSTVFIWMGIISVIVIIIGGVKYMTSQGDPGKVKSAKDTILYAVIGLIVSILAYSIVGFILKAL